MGNVLRNATLSDRQQMTNPLARSFRNESSMNDSIERNALPQHGMNDLEEKKESDPDGFLQEDASRTKPSIQQRKPLITEVSSRRFGDDEGNRASNNPNYDKGQEDLEGNGYYYHPPASSYSGA